MPQESVLGPLLFNIFISDVFHAIAASEICNFADDNTIYALSHHVQSMIAKLEIDIYNTLKWFDSNSMVANPSKFKELLLGLKTNQNLALEINGDVTTNSKKVKLLGVTIDSQLNFKGYVKTLCVKANSKMSALARVVKYKITYKKQNYCINRLLRQHLSTALDLDLQRRNSEFYSVV